MDVEFAKQIHHVGIRSEKYVQASLNPVSILILPRANFTTQHISIVQKDENLNERNNLADLKIWTLFMQLTLLRKPREYDRHPQDIWHKPIQIIHHQSRPLFFVFHLRLSSWL